MGLAETLDIDLEKEILAKMEINEKRVYKKNDKGGLEKQNK